HCHHDRRLSNSHQQSGAKRRPDYLRNPLSPPAPDRQGNRHHSRKSGRHSQHHADEGLCRGSLSRQRRNPLCRRNHRLACGPRPRSGHRIIERFGDTGEIEADDVFILNDPYLAAIHQSDVYMLCPIHYRDKLVGWSGTFVHVMDIGAMSPGGDSPGASEIFHERIRIPGLKLVERGKLRRDVFDTLTNMTRQPIMVGLDLKCQMAANNVAKSRMQEMYAEFGPEMLDGVSTDMIRYSESVLRKRITEIPDGSWSESNMIQGDENWKI